MNGWSGKNVWITGASSGIGRELALKLADLECTVIVSARREQALAELAALNPQYLLPVVVDVTRAEQRDEIRQQLAERVECIDVAIFSAGIVAYENSLDFNLDTYQEVFAVNYFGLVNSLAIAMPLLKKSSHKPYIVAITSLAMTIGFPRAEAYGASKAAADYFLKSLRADLPPKAFDLSIVRPGFVTTPMTAVNDFPMPFKMSAQEASDRIIKGMSRRKFLIEFPRRLHLLLKMFSWFPWVWYRNLSPRMSRYRNSEGRNQ